MNFITLLLVILIVLALTGGIKGYYPNPYGFGGAGLLLIILLVLYVTGRF